MTTTNQPRFGMGLFTIPKLLDQDFWCWIAGRYATGHLLEHRWWRRSEQDNYDLWQLKQKINLDGVMAVEFAS